MMNKFHAVRTYSHHLERWFASKKECDRAEELALAQKLGGISYLEFQKKFILSKSPKVTITIDFAYCEDGKQIFEDSKGVLLRDTRTKLAWLKQKFGISVILS